MKYYLDQGVTKAELSKRFGVSERTIYYWVAKGQLDRDLVVGGTRYASRRQAKHMLDPYKGIIDTRLDNFPQLSAQPLFDEVRTEGYSGSYGRVRDYVYEVRPRNPIAPTIRYETSPGRQGQVDFGTFTLPWGRRHALLVMLGSASPTSRLGDHLGGGATAREDTASAMRREAYRGGQQHSLGGFASRGAPALLCPEPRTAGRNDCLRPASAIADQSDW